MSSCANSNPLLQELKTLKAIPTDIINIIESYGTYQIVSGKVKWEIPPPPAELDVIAGLDNVAIVEHTVGDTLELHISKASPSVVSNFVKPTEHPEQQTNNHCRTTLDFSFDPSPFHKFTNIWKRFGNQRVVIDHHFIYTVEIWNEENKCGKYDIHVFDHNGVFLQHFTIETNYRAKTESKVVACCGYLWIAERSKKLYQFNLRQFSSRGKLTSSYFFDFHFNTFCMDPKGQHLFVTDLADLHCKIHKFKLNGKIHRHTEIMKCIDTYSVKQKDINRIYSMSADKRGGLVISINDIIPPCNIIRFSTKDNTISRLCKHYIHFPQISVSSNGNVIVCGADGHIWCFE